MPARHQLQAPQMDTPAHTELLATPPAWTEEAWCNAEWPQPTPGHKSRWDNDHTSDAEAAALCADCPVIAECLSAAMAEEGSLTARNRYGVRGGLSPVGRAALAAPAGCDKGHKGEMVADTDVRRNGWICLACRREAARRQAANFDEGQKTRKRARQREYRSRLRAGRAVA